MSTQDTRQPAGLNWNLTSRTAADLSADAGRRTADDVWRCVQRGLVYPSPHAIFATFFRREHPGPEMTKWRLGHILANARHMIHEKFPKAHTSLILGVSFGLWQEMSVADGLPLPVGIRLQSEMEPGQHRARVFHRPGTAFFDSGADLWFHIKSDIELHCNGVLEWLRHRLEEQEAWADGSRTVWQAASTKSNRPDNRGGKVLGCRFSENLNNATDPLTIQQQTIVGFEDPDHIGASFVLAQRFVINWQQILSMAPQHIEDLVGRTTNDTLVPSRDDRSHIKCARAQGEDGNTTSVLRLSLPFGQSKAIERNDLLEKGASWRDEEGIYFAGYAKSVRVLENIMIRQLGDEPGFMADRLLANVKANLGGFFYIPSIPDLHLAPESRTPDGTAVQRFPGVDWSRLDRHFDQTSANGYMHYNHKAYLYRMTTMSPAERQTFQPPSYRVLSLLADAFSRWQDNWYFDRAQREMSHLCVYLARDFGPAKAGEVMSLSIEERAGWAAKVLLGRVLTSDEYGFRGRRTDADGNIYNGADTYHINPLEILVGSMPNLGLGQGKYLIDFAREDEQLSNFFDNLSYASGVGHIVPYFGETLNLGLGTLTAQVAARRDAAPDEKQRRFFAGAVLALEGVADHCRAFARLADTMAARVSSGQTAERSNLGEIRDRMNRIAEHPPETLAEAAQLVFTLHSCLHHTGEPTAVGRLDQLLQPYYETDLRTGRIDEARAQEIIDCFWIKIGEKVQLNRQFVEDHQVFGNLAMGGSSGNYPQGSSLNQWIQQVTVGGTVADGAPDSGRPAYNDITRLCLRAARRLPLNAPCLSLRMRPDIPADLVHEASLAILSGGAHPILLSDAKIIPGLRQSGDGIGEGHGADGSTPVSAKAGGLWRSTVSLPDARDYACDGCYEPQLSGTSWFTLGGVITTQPLEAALNQGKAWQSAGPVWFRGQKISFTSEPVARNHVVRAADRALFQASALDVRQTAGRPNRSVRAYERGLPGPAPLGADQRLRRQGTGLLRRRPALQRVRPVFHGALHARQLAVGDPSIGLRPHDGSDVPCGAGGGAALQLGREHGGAVRERAGGAGAHRGTCGTLPSSSRGGDGATALRPWKPGGGQVRRRDYRPGGTHRRRDVHRSGRADRREDARSGAAVGHQGAAIRRIPDPARCRHVRELSRLGQHERRFGRWRLSGDPLASDLSPAPSFGDLPIDHNEAPLIKVMAGFAGPGVESMWDGAPTDFNIREDFPLESLDRALTAFANGRGSSIMTITCANPDTYAQAALDPEKYDLLRARMGGWTEFFVTMFPAHQAQHQRRPFETPES